MSRFACSAVALLVLAAGCTDEGPSEYAAACNAYRAGLGTNVRPSAGDYASIDDALRHLETILSEQLPGDVRDDLSAIVSALSEWRAAERTDDDAIEQEAFEEMAQFADQEHNGPAATFFQEECGIDP